MNKPYVFLLALVAGFICQGTAISALIDIPNLQSISFFEKSGGIQLASFSKTSQAITTRHSILTGSNAEMIGAAAEYYDFFYSNSDGTFNPNGSYITIEALYAPTLPAGGGLNLTAVRLNFVDSPAEFANKVEHFNALGDNANHASVDFAVDGDINTHTTMGNSTDQDNRLSITVSFASVPEPATVLILALGGLLLINRRVFTSFIHRD